MSPDHLNELEEYRNAWKADSDRTRVTIDHALLVEEVRQSQASFRSTVFWRDVREVVVGILTLGLWLYLGTRLSLPWTWYLTVPALVWLIGFILVDRRRHPQQPLEPGQPLMRYVKDALGQVEHQIWLLRNVFWWSLLPFSISIMAFVLQVAWQGTGNWWEFFLFAGFLVGFLVIIYGAIHLLNQWVVRVQLEPRRQDLAKLVESLEDETGEDNDHDIVELVSTLSSSASSFTWEKWAENWNIMVPSWTVAIGITLITLGGAWCGAWFPIPDMGPVFFQSVVAGVIAFEVALGAVWWRTRKRQNCLVSVGGRDACRSTVDSVFESSEKRSGRPQGFVFPNAPALWIIAWTLFVSGLAIVAFYRFVDDPRIRDAIEGGQGLDDISAFTEEDASHTDDWLQGFVESFYPSLSAVVVRDGSVVYSGTFGMEDVEAGRRATSQTQYHVASVTKVFTASLAVVLHHRGIVDLDQPIVNYLPPEVTISTTPEAGRRITLRHLASHTSGLPRRVPGRVQSVDGWYSLEPHRLYDHLAAVKLESDPGSKEEYSNLGYGLLGHALALAAGKPLDRLMQELICEPLQLEHTAIEADGTLTPATGYSRRSRSGLPSRHSYERRLAGSGGLVTSTADLAKFLAAQMQSGVFSKEMLDQLHTEFALSDSSAAETALGWSVESVEVVGRVLSKNGGRNNCSAWIGFAPDHRVGVAIVTNCGGPNVDPIGKMLLNRAIPLSRKVLIPDQLVTADGYAKVAPYTAVRWKSGKPIVRVKGRWLVLVSIDEIAIERIMKFANNEYGELARKRFAEDLVRVLHEMGHEPNWIVTLGYEKEDGEFNSMEVLMTTENRDSVRD